MLSRSKLLFATLAIAATMLGLVANASARNFTMDEKAFELTWVRALGFEAAGASIACRLTTLGHFFEQTLPKARAQVGVIIHVTPTTAGASTCTGGSITVLVETLPWKLNYSNFSGRLPDITSMRTDMVGVAFRASNGSVGCLGASTALKPASGEFIIGAGGRVEGFRLDERVRIPLGGSFICSFAGEGSFRGTAEVWDLPLVDHLTMDLI